MKDNINPPHYNALGATCDHCKGPVDVIVLTRRMDFNLGNAVKYAARAPFKGHHDDDLNKAAWYIHDEITSKGGTPQFVPADPTPPSPPAEEVPDSVDDAVRKICRHVLASDVQSIIFEGVRWNRSVSQKTLAELIHKHYPKPDPDPTSEIPPAPATLSEVTVGLTFGERDWLLMKLRSTITGDDASAKMVQRLITKFEEV